MAPDTQAEAYRRIVSSEEALWREHILFDSMKSVEDLIQYDREHTAPKYHTPGFYARARSYFRKDNRLFFALDCWRTYPDSLLRQVDSRAGLFPELKYDYAGLESSLNFHHKCACQYLVDVAELEGFDGAAIARAGIVTRLIVGEFPSRRKLWPDQSCTSDWPECHPTLLEAPAHVVRPILAGAGQIERLRSLLGRWRTPSVPVEPPKDSGATDPPEPPATGSKPALPEWDKDTHTLWFNESVIRKVRGVAVWIPILDSFQKHGWPPRIDIPKIKGDIGSHLRTLNANLEILHFFRDGSTKGICWKTR